jgi:hypothetical protein
MKPESNAASVRATITFPPDLYATLEASMVKPAFRALFFSLTLIAEAMLLAPGAKAQGGRVVDESQTVTLRGNTRPEAKFAQYDLGRVADDLPVEHLLLLLQRSLAQEQALETYIDSLNDKSSPNFHKWLTAVQLGEQYGVAPEDLGTVTNWLESHGFTVNTVYSNHIVIDFSGTAGEVRDAFHTELHYLRIGDQTHIANMSDPQIPAALAPVVQGIFSLNDFKPHPMYRMADPAYTFAGCATTTDAPTEPGTCYGVTAQDNQVIYNLTPLYPAAGQPDSTGHYSGQGLTIALVEDTDTYSGAGDWNYYRKVFGLARTFPYGTYNQVHPGGCADPGTNGNDIEAALDVEVASAIAPNANIELISCPSTTFTFGGLLAVQNLLNESGSGPLNAPGGVPVISMSYGLCEAATAPEAPWPSTTPFSRRLVKVSRFSSPQATKTRAVAHANSRPTRNTPLPAKALPDGVRRPTTSQWEVPISRTSITRRLAASP